MQNKIFLDTNVFIDILFDEKSFLKYNHSQRDADLIKSSKELIEKYISQDYKISISSLSLANAFYILSKKDNKGYFATIISNFENNELFEVITDTFNLRKKAWRYSIKNNADYEDALQYFSALENNCSAIITNDKNFPKLDIPLIRTNSDTQR